jgi:hypothetical protein
MSRPWIRPLVVAALAAYGCACCRMALAQAEAPLPLKMSGHWTALAPGGRTFVDSLSIVLDAPAQSGAITGRLTLRGVTCGASDEPLQGTWDGTELRFESRVRPNVNAARPNGDCGNGTVSFVLARKAGTTAFTGESRRDGSPVPSQITLAP